MYTEKVLVPHAKGFFTDRWGDEIHYTCGQMNIFIRESDVYVSDRRTPLLNIRPRFNRATDLVGLGGYRFTTQSLSRKGRPFYYNEYFESFADPGMANLVSVEPVDKNGVPHKESALSLSEREALQDLIPQRINWLHVLSMLVTGLAVKPAGSYDWSAAAQYSPQGKLTSDILKHALCPYPA